MIKANELRVGNLMGPYISTVVKKINWQDIRECKIYPNIFNSNNQRIKLNEQWLIDLGFEYNDFDETYFKDIIRITKDLEVFVGLCLLPKKKYVHQIQNLYFALTGEELTIKKN